MADINTYALSIELGLADKYSDPLTSVEKRLTVIEEQIATIAAKGMVQFQVIATQIETSISQIATQYQKVHDLNTLLLKPAKEQDALGQLSQRRLIDESALLKDKLLVQWLEIDKMLGGKQKKLDQEHETIKKEKETVDRTGQSFGFWSGQIDKAARSIKQVALGLVDVTAHFNLAFQATEKFHLANMRLVDTMINMAEHTNELTAAHGLYHEEAMLATAELADANIKVGAEMDKLIVTVSQFNRLSGVSIRETVTWTRALSAAGMSANEATRYTEYMARAMRTFGLNSRETSAIMATQEQQLMRLRQLYTTPVAQEWIKTSTVLSGLGKQLNMTEAQIKNMNQAVLGMDVYSMRQLAALAGVSAEELKTVEGQTKAWTTAVAQVAEQFRKVQDPMARDAIIAAQFAYLTEQEQQALKDMAMQVADNNKEFADTADFVKAGQDSIHKLTEEGMKLDEIFAESNRGIVAQLKLLLSAFQGIFGAIGNFVESAIVPVLQYLNVAIKWIAKFIMDLKAGLESLGPVGTVLKVVIGVIVALIIVVVLIGAALATFIGFAGFAAAVGKSMGAILHYTLAGLAQGLKALAGYTWVMLVLAVLILSVGASAYLLARAVQMIADEGKRGALALAGLTIAILALGLGLALVGYIANKVWYGLLTLAVVLIAAGIAAYLFALGVSLIAKHGWAGVGVMFALVVAFALFLTVLLVAAYFAPSVAVGIGILESVLIVLGVTLLLVAAAAWVFAQAVAVIAKQGAAGAIAIVLLTIAIVAMIWAISAAGVAAAAASYGLGILALVLLAIAAVILSIGLAAIMIGTGFMLAGKGAVLLAQAVEMVVKQGEKGLQVLALLVGAIIGFAAMLMVLGTVSMLAAPGLIILAIVLFAVGIAMLMVGIGAWLLAQAIKIVAQQGDAGARAIGLLTGAIVSLILTLAAISPVALLAAPGLIILSFALIAVGIAILMVGIGAYLLAQAVKVLAEQGKAGSRALAELTEAIITLAFGLAFAGAIALIAAPGLAALSIAIVAIGLGMLMAGVGAWLLAKAIGMLVATMKELDYSTGGKLIVFAGALVIAAGILMGAAGTLLGAGIALMIAAIILVIAAAIFVAAAAMLASAMEDFGPAAEALNAVAPGFLEAGIYIGIGGIYLLIGAAAALAAAAVLALLGPALWLASWSTEKGLKAMLQSAAWADQVGSGFRTGGTGMYEGGQLMLASADILADAGRQLAGSATDLQAGLAPLLVAAAQVSIIGPVLNQAAAALSQGATNLWLTAIMLDMAARRLVAPADELARAAATLAPALRDLAASLEIPIGNLFMVFTDEVQVSALALYTTLDGIVTMLDVYANRVELAASRIAAAFRRAVPTAAITMLGLGLIRAETVTTAPVVERARQADEIRDRQQYLREVKAQTERIGEVTDKLEAIRLLVDGLGGAGPGTPLGAILDLLRTHLPEIAAGGGGGTGLQTPMTDWMR